MNKYDNDTRNKNVPDGFLPISIKDEYNMDKLYDLILLNIKEILGAGGGFAPTRDRHIKYLQEASGYLVNFIDGYGNMFEDELAQEIKLCANAIGKITGEIDTEEVLGEIFSNFCIGK